MSNFNDLATVLNNLEQYIDWKVIENMMIKRIWGDNITSDGKSIPSDLFKTGKLKSSFTIRNGKIYVESYAKALESKYGKIFELSIDEYNELIRQINNIINERSSK